MKKTQLEIRVSVLTLSQCHGLIDFFRQAKLDKIRKEKQNQKKPALTAMVTRHALQCLLPIFANLHAPTMHADRNSSWHERGVVVSTLAGGDKKTYPQKGGYLSVHYTGVLRVWYVFVAVLHIYNKKETLSFTLKDNGNEFDSSWRKKKPFKVVTAFLAGFVEPLLDYLISLHDQPWKVHHRERYQNRRQAMAYHFV